MERNASSNQITSPTTQRDNTLTDSELDAVTGGVTPAPTKLYEACCKGTHISNVVIE
jgi:hypothetical protein